MEKKEIIEKLEKHGFEFNIDWGPTLGFKRDGDKASIMYSKHSGVDILSISFNGQVNEKKARSIIKQIFPTAKYIQQGVVLSASYFSIEPLN
jgi:hypothetical protein|nr:MAG TPA: hypothetical protein [Caudoviricetes sp.]